VAAQVCWSRSFQEHCRGAHGQKQKWAAMKRSDRLRMLGGKSGSTGSSQWADRQAGEEGGHDGLRSCDLLVKGGSGD
jgi:hypothetical protein